MSTRIEFWQYQSSAYYFHTCIVHYSTIIFSQIPESSSFKFIPNKRILWQKSIDVYCQTSSFFLSIISTFALYQSFQHLAEEVASRDSSKGKENYKEKPFNEGGAADVLLIPEEVIIYVCILKQELEVQ